MNAERLGAPGKATKSRGRALAWVGLFACLLGALAGAGCATVTHADYARDSRGLDVVADFDISGWPVQVSILDEARGITVCAAAPGNTPSCVQAAKRAP